MVPNFSVQRSVLRSFICYVQARQRDIQLAFVLDSKFEVRHVPKWRAKAQNILRVQRRKRQAHKETDTSALVLYLSCARCNLKVNHQLAQASISQNIAAGLVTSERINCPCQSHTHAEYNISTANEDLNLLGTHT